MTELPVCRWRGVPTAGGRWECRSPKLIVSHLGVPGDLCRSCYRRNHEPFDAPAQPTRVVHPVCPHRGAPVRQADGSPKTRECEACGARRVRLKLFGCDHPDTPDEVTDQDCGRCPHRPPPVLVPVRALEPLPPDGHPDRSTSPTGVTPAAGPVKLRLVNRLAPGDVLVMTAAVESLHRAHPGRFVTAVDTSGPALWDHNPWVAEFPPDAPGVTDVPMQYPLIQRCNQRPVHFLQGYCEFLADRLGVPVPLAVNRPVVYLSDEEKGWMSQVQEITGRPTRFWLVNAGTKSDFTAKGWGLHHYQELVDLLAGRVQFVQVGDVSHRHRPLRGVIDLLGRTDLRQLVRLTYHAEGVVCGTTLLMHLAAALATPAVILAGGREPRSWNTYPRQTLLSTVGALACCRDGACWRSRTVRLEDGAEQDNSLCEQPVFGPEPVPRCLALIRPAEVAAAVERYYVGGAVPYA